MGKIIYSFILVVCGKGSIMRCAFDNTSLNNHHNVIRQTTYWYITIKGFSHDYLWKRSESFLIPFFHTIVQRSRHVTCRRMHYHTSKGNFLSWPNANITWSTSYNITREKWYTIITQSYRSCLLHIIIQLGFFHLSPRTKGLITHEGNRHDL
jgi:hypothetical protein